MRSAPTIISTGRHPNGRQTLTVAKILNAHGYTDPTRATLTYVCLECGSIGESESADARDANVEHYDFTCCDPSKTVVFHTIKGESK